MKTKKPDNTQLETSKPKRFQSVNRNVMFFKEQIDYLEMAAKVLQCSQAEIIRKAVDEYRVNHKQDMLEHLKGQIDDLEKLKDILAADPAENFTVAEVADFMLKNGKLPQS